MTKFKKGDLARCVSQGYNPEIMIGGVYEVQECDDEFLSLDTESETLFYVHRFVHTYDDLFNEET